MADYRSIHSVDDHGKSKWQKLTYHLRDLRLHLVLQCTAWGKDKEVRKVALRQNRLTASVHVLTLSLPVAIAVTLLSINLRGIFVGNTPTTTLTGIQFAAKLSELFMQASLVNVALGLVRLRLLHGELPLGGLVAPYRLNSVSYLWSLEFWGFCTSRECLKLRNLCLGILVVLLVALAALVGPSIAVLMLPRPMSAEIGRNLVLSTFSTSALTQMVKQSSWNLTSASIDRISRTATAWLDTDGKDLLVVAGDGYSAFAQALQVESTPDSTFSASVQTKISTAVFAALSEYPVNIDEGYITLVTPQVNVTTSYNVIDSEVLQMSGQVFVNFSQGYDTDETLNNLIQVAELDPRYESSLSDPSKTHFVISWSDANGQTTSHVFVWHDLPSEDHQHSILLASAIWIGNSSDPKSLAPLTGDACIIDARWIDYRVNATSDVLLSSSLLLPHSEVGTSTMSVSPKWINSNLMPLLQSSIIALNDAPLSNVEISTIALLMALTELALPSEYDLVSFGAIEVEVYEHSDPSFSDMCLSPSPFWTEAQCESVLASAYADTGRSEDSYIDVIFVTGNSSIDPTTMEHVEMTLFASGYWYYSDGVAVRLSLAVMCIYLLVVCSYAIFTMLTGFAATSWDSMAELMMLALNSNRPQHLRETSVGVDTMQTFREPVSIQVNYENTLEMVFVNDVYLNKRRYRGVQNWCRF